VQRAADEHVNLFCSKADRGAAAVHRRISAAEHDHLFSNARYVFEGDIRQPFNADADGFGFFVVVSG